MEKDEEKCLRKIFNEKEIARNNGIKNAESCKADPWVKLSG